MKYPFQVALTAIFAATVTAGAALTPVATSGSSDGSPPGTLVDVMRSILNDPSYDANAPVNRVQDTGPGVTDQVWTIHDSATAVLILEIAGNRNINRFGIYNLSTKETLEIFSGTDSGLVSQSITFTGGTATVGANSLAVGNQFGFYLSTVNGPTWYSRQSDNPHGLDQMVTLKTDENRTLYLDAAGLGSWALAAGTQLDWKAGEYLLAWEDLAVTGGDKDYQDMLIKVSAVPVPEPSTYVAGALALVPLLLGLRWRRIRRD
ncbi:MAG: hypothetical protein KF833_02270 [Verrucomicrobiae bacterium]|nr:hypothetical protein [Verrucomicrobiae bacterium]